MKRYFLLLAVLAALALSVACAPTGGQESVAVEPTAGATGETKTLYVDPAQVECTGVGPQMCLQVKEDPAGDYQLFYDTIEGFTFEPGYAYELLVRVETVANPPADGSSLRYVLIEEVGRTSVNVTDPPALMEDNDLQGVRWILLSYPDAAGEIVEAMPDREVTVEFRTDGSLGGFGGCNQYFASYTVNGSDMTISQAGSTMMACVDPGVMEQEAAFLAALGSAAAWQIENEQLVIANSAGEIILTFRAGESASLTGTTWSATGYNNGNQAVVSLVADTTLTATFTEDGQLNGSAGCNNFMTSYTVDGQNITIQPAATTRKMCPGEGVMEQETQFLNALTTAATWRIDGDKLELRTADGALAGSFLAQ